MQKALAMALFCCPLLPLPAGAETSKEIGVLRTSPTSNSVQSAVPEKKTPVQPPPVRIVGRTSVYSEAEVERAIELFRTYCQPLGGDAWHELTNITARITPEFSPERQAKGWKTVIHLAVTLPRKPNLIPVNNSKLGNLGVARSISLWVEPQDRVCS